MSDDPFLSLLHSAWEKIKPALDRDPDELARRLARRRQGMMRRPPRAWCLAIRASDTRINPASAACVPEDAAYPTRCLRGVEPWYSRHEVTITAELLRKICRPYFIPSPGITPKELAEQLGCDVANLTWAIQRGKLPSERTNTGIMGRAETRVYTDKPLDPCTPRCFEHADPLWGTTWRYLGDHVPEDLEQTIERVPRWTRKPPKWRGDDDELVFRGWDWICPGCAEPRRVLFYPIEPLYGVQLLGREFPDGHIDALPAPMCGFACTHCHNVLYFSRINADAWNHLISHLSGGLLYGGEVPRPEGFKYVRKKNYRHSGKAPSKRRAEVRECLLRGLSYSQTAIYLRVSKSTVNKHARELYRQENVKGPGELRKKLVGGSPAVSPISPGHARGNSNPKSTAPGHARG